MTSSPSDPLAATQAALPISLIATPREALFTCSWHDKVSEVIHRYADYDHIPVTEDGSAASRVLGLLDTHKFREAECPEAVANFYVPLCEEHLIGSDASIIEFIWDAPEHDCRLLVSGKSISGIVTLSDLQALPVRAALFALVTRLELVMTECIKREFDGSEVWRDRLTAGRREKLDAQIASAKEGDAYVEALLYTQFADKIAVIAKSKRLPGSRSNFERDLSDAQKLRDGLAHANEYAATRADALKVCATVQKISEWIERLGGSADEPTGEAKEALKVKAAALR